MEHAITCNVDRDNYTALSEVCTNGTDSVNIECVKHDDVVTLVFRYLEGVWYFIIFLIGTFGNFATLVSIPFAVNRKLNGFDQNFNSTTIFILYVSFVDLCHCLMYTLPTSYAMLFQQWPFGTFWCNLCGYVQSITSYFEFDCI